jgi:hypothetical protein
MKSLLFSAAILLSACTTPMPAMLDQPMPSAFDPGSASKQQFSKDNYECERDGKNITGSDCRQMNLYESCMASKGYRPIPGTAKKGDSCR